MLASSDTQQRNWKTASSRLVVTSQKRLNERACVAITECKEMSLITIMREYNQVVLRRVSKLVHLF